MHKKLVIFSIILRKKNIIFKASVWKINFFTCDGFSVRKIIFFTPSMIRGCEEKKSKCVENGHKKFEITRKIKKRNLVFGY